MAQDAVSKQDTKSLSTALQGGLDGLGFHQVAVAVLQVCTSYSSRLSQEPTQTQTQTQTSQLEASASSDREEKE